MSTDTIRQCAICGSTDESDLVRDHDHKTGIIRGVLCRQCNSWLGVYEANLHRTKPCGRWKFKQWCQQFEPQIQAHLQSSLNMPYTGQKMSSFWRMLYESVT